LQSLLQGVELVQREFTAALAKHHVIEIEAQGKPFNPALHEAMAQIDSETAESNTIIDVLEKGYQLHDRLVRPSRVVVAREREEEAEPDAGNDGENAD
jgi:molecular chaperone GrpE